VIAVHHNGKSDPEAFACGPFPFAWALLPLSGAVVIGTFSTPCGGMRGMRTHVLLPRPDNLRRLASRAP